MCNPVICTCQQFYLATILLEVANFTFARQRLAADSGLTRLLPKVEACGAASGERFDVDVVTFC